MTAQRQVPETNEQMLWSRHWSNASQQQPPPQSPAPTHEPPPLAALPPVALPPVAEPEIPLELAVDATEFDAALLPLLAVLETLVALLELTDVTLEATLEAVAPPAPLGCVSKSVVEPVAQLMTRPKPAANAPTPYMPDQPIRRAYRRSTAVSPSLERRWFAASTMSERRCRGAALNAGAADPPWAIVILCQVHMRCECFLAMGVAAAVFMACGGTNDTGPGGAGGAVASSASLSSTSQNASSSSGIVTVPDCEGTGLANAGKKVAIGTVTVTVHDADGMALPSSAIDVQLCGSDLCLFGKSTDGTFTLTHGGKELVDPALKIGSQSSIAYLFWGGAIPKSPDHAYGIVTAVKLGAPGGKLEKGATVTSNGVSVTFAADARVEQELLAPADEFAAVVFKPSAGTFPQLAATTQKFELVVGLGPADVDVCPPAKLTFPNSEGWAPKTAVELWVNGVKTYDNWAPYGTWAKAVDAVVSDDGKTVSTVDGKGISTLAAYGVVKK